MGERAPAHKGKRRDFNTFFFDQLGQLLAGQEIIQGIIKRLHIRIDFILHIPRQISKLLSGFNGGTA